LHSIKLCSAFKKQKIKHDKVTSKINLERYFLRKKGEEIESSSPFYKVEIYFNLLLDLS
jgi:hypothetical protein